MHSFEIIMQAIHDRIPKTNKFVLKEFPEKMMNGLKNDVGTICSEATSTVPGALEYVGYEVADPYQHAKFDMRIGRGTSIKPEVPTSTSSWSLVKYNFIHKSMDGDRPVSLHLYIPYLKNGFLVINSKEMVIRKGISETVFSRMDEKGFHGILVRPMRVKIKFEMDRIQPLFSARDPNVSYGHEFYTRVQLYTGKIKGKQRADTTDLLYLLAKFGLEEVLRKFNIDPNEIQFTQEIDDDPEYDYFSAKDVGLNGVPIYMKVRVGFIVAKDAEEEHSKQFKLQRKVVANLVYLLSRFEFQRIQEIYDPSGSIWRTMVGKIISPKKSDVEARGDAENHFISAEGFIDPTTRGRFARFGYPEIVDTYSLLEYVFLNINRMMANTVPQDLYQKRVDITDAFVVDVFARSINQQFYRIGHGKSNLKASEVSDILKIKPDLAASLKNSSKSAVEVVDTNPTITTDNQLISCFIFKARHGGHAKERFHPSIAYAESLNALAGKEAGHTGMINPFVQITEQGKIVKAEWCKELDPIMDFLPRN